MKSSWPNQFITPSRSKSYKSDCSSYWKRR